MRMSESFSRRRLPHWDMPDAAYFITTCLEGSIPAQGLLDLARYRAELKSRPRPEDVDEGEWRQRLDKLAFARLDGWLDERPAVRRLADPRLAQVVVDSMYHFAGERYDLLAFVVMPSHVHWLFQPLATWVESLPEEEAFVGQVSNLPYSGQTGQVGNLPHSNRRRTPRERIQHAFNRHTASKCNELLGSTGQFWQHESYDHWVRDAAELERIISYIEANPVKAQLVASPEEFVFSSAYARKRLSLEVGVPLMHPS